MTPQNTFKYSETKLLMRTYNQSQFLHSNNFSHTAGIHCHADIREEESMALFWPVTEEWGFTSNTVLETDTYMKFISDLYKSASSKSHENQFISSKTF